MGIRGNLLNNKVTVAVGEVKTKLGRLDLHELGDVDGNSCNQGGYDVDQGPVVLSLDLAVVVRATDSQVTLEADTDDEVDTGADTDPAHI